MYFLLLLTSTGSTVLSKLMEQSVFIPNDVLIESSCCQKLICPYNNLKSTKTRFRHPLLMTILMFFGEFLLLPLGLILKPEPIPEEKLLPPPKCLQNCLGLNFHPEKLESIDDNCKEENPVVESNKLVLKRLNPLVYAVPALFDITGSVLSFMALNLLHASTF